MYTHLISAQQLQELQAGGKPLMIFDCSHDLGNPQQASQDFLSKHIPGAVFVSMDAQLSAHDAQTAVNGGRHPLPTREHFAQTLCQLGFANDMQAVVYDNNDGKTCGRMWWMLKWAGHDAVAILDGGLQAWEQAGGQLESGPEKTVAPSRFKLGQPLRQWIDSHTLADYVRTQQDVTILDARASERFCGQNETLDPVAGHIPGAINRPTAENFDAQGRYKPHAQLKTEFDQLLTGRTGTTTVMHCGSGISVIPNLVAWELAGLPPAILYAGSWSEWIEDDSRPVAKS